MQLSIGRQNLWGAKPSNSFFRTTETMCMNGGWEFPLKPDCVKKWGMPQTSSIYRKQSVDSRGRRGRDCITKNTASYFHWSNRLTSFIFEKISAAYPSLNSNSLLTFILSLPTCILSSKNNFLWKKKKSFEHIPQTMAYMLFLETIIVLQYTEVIYMSFHFIRD